MIIKSYNLYVIHIPKINLFLSCIEISTILKTKRFKIDPEERKYTESEELELKRIVRDLERQDQANHPVNAKGKRETKFRWLGGSPSRPHESKKKSKHNQFVGFVKSVRFHF